MSAEYAPDSKRDNPVRKEQVTLPNVGLSISNPQSSATTHKVSFSTVVRVKQVDRIPAVSDASTKPVEYAPDFGDMPPPKFDESQLPTPEYAPDNNAQQDSLSRDTSRSGVRISSLGEAISRSSRQSDSDNKLTPAEQIDLENLTSSTLSRFKTRSVAFDRTERDWEEEFQTKYEEVMRIRKVLKDDLSLKSEQEKSVNSQSAYESNDKTAKDELLKEEFNTLVVLYAIYRDFTETARQSVREVIDSIYLPGDERNLMKRDWTFGGVAGGLKILPRHNIFFKIANDGPSGSCGLYDGDEFAMKAMGKEFANMKEVFSLKISHVCIPLACLIDYHGFRVLCQSLLPIDLEARPAYGSNDKGKNCFDSDPAIRLTMSEIGKNFNMKRHVVGSVEKSFIFGPVDIEGHRSDNGRLYLLDFGRLLPPSAPPQVLFCLLFCVGKNYPVETEVRISRYEVEIGDMIGSHSIDFRETELGLLAVEQGCLGDNSAKKRRSKNEFLSELLIGENMSVRGDAILIKGRKNHFLYQFLRIEAVRRQKTTLSCDAFSSFQSIGTATTGTTFAEISNEQIRRATDDVLVSGMTELCAKLSSLEVQDPRYLTVLCKQHGVNMRYLGLIRSRISPIGHPRLRKTIMVEMVGRVLKSHIRSRIRSNAVSPTRVSVVSVLVQVLNEIFSIGSKFWKAKLKIMILLKYGFLCSPFDSNENQFEYSLENSVSKLQLLRLLIVKCGIFLRPDVQHELVSNADRFSSYRPFSESDFADQCLDVSVKMFDFSESIHKSISEILEVNAGNSKKEGIEIKRMKRRYLREAFGDSPSLIVSIFEEAWLRASSSQIDREAIHNAMLKGICIMKSLESVPLEVFAGCYIIISEIFARQELWKSSYPRLNVARQAFEYVFEEPSAEQMSLHPFQLIFCYRLREIGDRLALSHYLPGYALRSDSREEFSVAELIQSMYPPYETGVCLSKIEMNAVLTKSSDYVRNVQKLSEEDSNNDSDSKNDKIVRITDDYRLNDCDMTSGEIETVSEEDMFPAIESGVDANEDEYITQMYAWGSHPIGLPIPESVRDPSPINGFAKKVVSVAVTNDATFLITADPARFWICGVDYSELSRMVVSQFKDISFLLRGSGTRVYADSSPQENPSSSKPIIAVIMRDLSIQLPFQEKSIKLPNRPLIRHVVVQRDDVYLLADSAIHVARINVSSKDSEVSCSKRDSNVKSFDCFQRTTIFCDHGNDGTISLCQEDIYTKYKFENDRIKSVKIDSFSAESEIYFAHGSNLYVFRLTQNGVFGITAPRSHRDSIKQYFILPNGITIIDQDGIVGLWSHKADLEAALLRLQAENSARLESKTQSSLQLTKAAKGFKSMSKSAVVTILSTSNVKIDQSSSEWFSLTKLQSFSSRRQILDTVSASSLHQVAVLRKYGVSLLSMEEKSTTSQIQASLADNSEVSWELPFVNVWSDGYAIGVPCPLFRDRLVKKIVFSTKLTSNGCCACFMLSGNRPYSWVYMSSTATPQDEIQANSFGILGHGSLHPVTTPTEISTIVYHKIVDLCAGDSHALFLSAKGDIFGCGRSDCLGKGFSAEYSFSLAPRFVFVPFQTDDKAVACVAFGDNSAILTEKGEVWSWTSSAAQISENERPNKIVFPNNSVVVAKIGAGRRYFIAATVAADLYVWGNHDVNSPFVEQARINYCTDARNDAIMRNFPTNQLACPLKHSMITSGVVGDFPQNLPTSLVSLSCAEFSFSLIVKVRVDTNFTMSIIRSNLRFYSIPFRNHDTTPVITKDSPFYRELVKPAEISLVFAAGSDTGYLSPWENCDSATCPSTICRLVAEVEDSPNLQITTSGTGTVVVCGPSCEAWAWGSVGFRKLLQSGNSQDVKTSVYNIPINVGRLLGFKVATAVLGQPSGPNIFICDAMSYLYGWFYRKFVDGKNIRACQTIRRYMICDDTGMLRSYADCSEQTMVSFIAGEVWEVTGMRGREDKNKEPPVTPRGINLQYRDSYRLVEDMTCVTVDPSNRCQLTFYRGSNPPLSLTSEFGSEATAMLVKRMLDVLDSSICVNSLTSELDSCSSTSKIVECGHVLDQMLIWALREPECISQLAVEKLTSILQVRTFCRSWKILNTVTSVLFYACQGEFRDDDLYKASIAISRNATVLQQAIRTLHTLTYQTTDKFDQDQFDSVNGLTDMLLELKSISVYGSQIKPGDLETESLVISLIVMIIQHILSDDDKGNKVLISCLLCILTSQTMSNQGSFWRLMNGKQRGISAISMMLNASPQSLKPSFNIDDLIDYLTLERKLFSNANFISANKSDISFIALQSVLEYDLQFNIHRILCIWFEQRLASKEIVDSRIQRIFDSCIISCLQIASELAELMNNLDGFERLISEEKEIIDQSPYQQARTYLCSVMDIENAPKLLKYFVEVLERKGEKAAKLLHILTRYLNVVMQLGSQSSFNVPQLLSRYDQSIIDILFQCAYGGEWSCIAVAKFLSCNLLLLAKCENGIVSSQFHDSAIFMLRRVLLECSVTREDSRRATSGRICAVAFFSLCLMRPCWYSPACNKIDVSKTLIVEMMQPCNDPIFIMYTNIAFANFCSRSGEGASYFSAFRGYFCDLIAHSNPLVSYTASYVASLWCEDFPRPSANQYVASTDGYPSLVTMSLNNAKNVVGSCFCFNFGGENVSSLMPHNVSGNGYFEVVLHTSDLITIGILSHGKYYDETSSSSTIGTYAGSVGICHSHILHNRAPSFLERRSWNTSDRIGIFVDWNPKDLYVFINGKLTANKSFGTPRTGSNRDSIRKFFGGSKVKQAANQSADFLEGWHPGVTLGPLQAVEVIVDSTLFKYDYQAEFGRVAEEKLVEQARKLSTISESSRPSKDLSFDSKELSSKSSIASFINRMKSSAK